MASRWTLGALHCRQERSKFLTFCAGHLTAPKACPKPRAGRHCGGTGAELQLARCPAGRRQGLRPQPDRRGKSQIRTAQVRAAVSVNREMVLLYWGIGKEILSRQKEDGWGTRVIDRLARDLRSEFPDMKGISPRNLKYMRAFAEVWPDAAIVQQAAAHCPGSIIASCATR